MMTLETELELIETDLLHPDFEMTVQIDPKAWKRQERGRYNTYTDHSVRGYKKTISQMGRVVRGRRPIIGSQVPLIFIARFMFARPKTVTRPYPCVVPDFDNLAKGVADALNKVWYHDDGAIVDADVKKRYTNGPGYIYVAVKGKT